MVERVTRKNENLESELPLTISAQYGLIDQNEFFDKRIASRDVSGYYLLKKGEFAYNKSTSSDAPWGAVKRLDRYEMGVLSTLYIVFALKKDGNIDSDFLVSYYDTDCWHKGVQAIAAEGARNHGLLNITPADYFETVLTVPSDVKEQHQIGTFFAKLDTLITLHQRECFSFDFGSRSAKVAQKTISWEQRKVGVFYDFKNGLNKGKAFFGHVTPIVNFTDVFHNRSLYCKDLCGRVSLSREEINNFNVHKGDLFFTRTSETIEEIGYSSVMMDEPESTVFSGFVLRGRAVDDDPLENIFKSYVFFTDTFRKEMIMKSSMTTRALTSGTAIKKMLFYYPSDKTEQKRIGSLLEHLDHLITLHQRKLITIKKSQETYSWLCFGTRVPLCIIFQFQIRQTAQILSEVCLLLD